MKSLKLNKELVGGSLILLITFNIYNFLNFVFQFSMARFLTISDYGILATLMSIIYITGIFSESIQNLVAKNASEKINFGKLKNIVKRIANRSILVAAIILISYLIIALPLALFTHIDYYLFAINGLMVFAAFFVPLTRGVMQGQKRFSSLGINLIVESSFKLVASIVLVFIGWKVYGAVIGIVLGSLVAFLLSFVSLKDIFSSNEKNAETTKLKLDIRPVFIITSCILVFYSLDIIIAKMVFSPEIAGAYAVVSVLSKALFWGTQPISKAMFPISASSQKKKSSTLFLNSLLLVSLLLIVGLSIIYFFPDFLTQLFSGNKVSSLGHVLLYLSLGTSVLAITNLVLLSKLSKNKINKPVIFTIFIALEIVLLFTFSQSIISFSLAFLASSVIFLIGAIFIKNRNE